MLSLELSIWKGMVKTHETGFGEESRLERLDDCRDEVRLENSHGLLQRKAFLPYLE